MQEPDTGRLGFRRPLGLAVIPTFPLHTAIPAACRSWRYSCSIHNGLNEICDTTIEAACFTPQNTLNIYPLKNASYMSGFPDRSGDTFLCHRTVACKVA